MRHCMLYDWIGWLLSCICHFFYNLYTDTLCILSQWQIWAVVHSSSFTSGPLWPHSARWIDRGLFTRQPRGVEQSGAVRDGVVTWGYAGYVWPHTPPYIPPTNSPYIPTPPLLHSHLFDHLLCVCDIKVRVSKMRFMLVILDHIHPHNIPPANPFLLLLRTFDSNTNSVNKISLVANQCTMRLSPCKGVN